MPRQPAKPAADAEPDRHRDQTLSRFLRVIARGGEVVELAPRPGYRITFSDEIEGDRVDGDRRRVRITIGPAGKPAQDV